VASARLGFAETSAPSGESAWLPPFLQGRVHLLSPDSGTKVVVVEDHRAPLLFLQLQFPGGTSSAFIRRHPAAYAAFTRRARARNFTQEAEELAIEIHPYLTSSKTVLSASFLKEDLGTATHLLRELLYDRDGVAPPAERRRWNPVAIQSVTSPASDLRQRAYGLFCPKVPSRRPLNPAPVPQTSAKEDPFFNRDRQLRFSGRILGVAGDITAPEAEEIIAALRLPPTVAPDPGEARTTTLAKRPQNSAAESEVTCLKPNANSWEFRRPQLTQVYFAFARVAPARNEPDYVRLVLAGEVLRKRLYDNFSQTGDTYVISAGGSFGRRPGFYSIYSFTKTERAGQFEQKLRQYVQHFGEEGITEQELTQAIQSLRTRQLFSMRRPEDILDGLMADVGSGGPIGGSYAVLAQLSQITLAEVNTFVHKFYQTPDFVMVKLVPSG
jgi:predicted Zn-dependent peptidase